MTEIIGRVGWRTFAPTQNAFTMTIDTTKAGSASDTFILPCGTGGVYNAVIDWGDSTTSTITAFNDTDLTHVYSVGGVYTIKISGSLPQIIFNNGGDRLKVLSIDKWGNNQWLRLLNSFRGCSNLVINAIDIPNTSLVTSLISAFQNCTSLTSFSMAGWDLSSCTYLGGGFQGSFNGCTSLIDFDFTGTVLNTTSNVSMREMFWNCTSLTTVTGFNTLNTSKVTSLYYAFRSCTSLTSLDMSGIDLSNCSDFLGMFYTCSSLTSVDLTGITFRTLGINVSSMFNDTTLLTTIEGIENISVPLTNIIATFKTCGITGDLDLTGWDVSQVTSLSQTFQGSSFTSIDISGWNLSNCTTWGAKYAGAFSGGDAAYINVTDVTIRTAGTVTMYETFSLLGTCDIIGLDTWDISQVNQITDFMNGTKITTVEYDKLLIAWNSQDAVNSLAVKFGTSQYTLGSAAATARASLISTDLWTITDGGGI